MNRDQSTIGNRPRWARVPRPPARRWKELALTGALSLTLAAPTFCQLPSQKSPAERTSGSPKPLPIDSETKGAAPSKGAPNGAANRPASPTASANTASANKEIANKEIANKESANKASADGAAKTRVTPTTTEKRESGVSARKESGSARLPFEINYRDPVEAMRQGGPIMWPILLCSVAAITFGLERLVSLRRGRVAPRRLARRWRHRLDDRSLDRDGAMDLCRKDDSPLGRILLSAARRWGRPRREIEPAVTEAGRREVLLLRRNLRALSGTGNLATLLGLLGTVVGMIDAFNSVADKQGLGRAEVLSRGIAQALLTTAFGLAVAIPCLFLHAYFSGKVERLALEMDQIAEETVEAIAVEPVDMNPSSPTRAPAPTRSTPPRYVS